MRGEADRQHAAAVETVALTLRIDAATAEVVRALEAESVDAVLLKGPVTRRWLYADGTPRPYLDSDVLVNPAKIQAAGAVLTALGFECRLDEECMPRWWRTHESVWVREADAVCLDLHNSIPGIGVDPSVAWDVFTAASETIDVGGVVVRILDAPSRTLQLALHATQHGRLPSRALVDLERGVELCDWELWQEAARLAHRLGAIDAFAAGLRLTEAGSALAERLQLPPVGSVQVALAASFPPAGALTLDDLMVAGSLRRRASIVLRKLVPPAAYMRVWAPESAHGRLALARAYARRPFWILQKAPHAIRAYRRARRVVREAGDRGSGVHRG